MIFIINYKIIFQLDFFLMKNVLLFFLSKPLITRIDLKSQSFFKISQS